MVTACRYLTWVGVALLLAPSGAARAQGEDEAPARARPRAGLIARILHLIPPAFTEELNLNPEQRKKLHELQQEFRQKRRAILVKTALKVAAIVDSLEEGREGGETAPV